MHAVRRVRLVDLVLEETRGGSPDPDEAARLLAGLLAEDPWRHIESSAGLRATLARLAWAKQALPELPDIGDREVAEAAATLCSGQRSLRGLRAADVENVLLAGLPPQCRAKLASVAPERWQLPSGRRVAIDYAAEAGPTVAAQVQEFFGTDESRWWRVRR